MHGIIKLPGSTTGDSLKDTRLLVHRRVIETGFNYSSCKKTLTLNCNCCGDTAFKLYAHQDRYGLPVRSMQCTRCGLIFITPRMVKKAYDEFYEHWYRKLIDAFNGRQQSEHIVRHSSEVQANEAMKFLGEHLPKQLQIKSILDVGGSTGVFAKKVCETTGAMGVVIDPNSKELKEAAEKGLTVSKGSFEDYKTDREFELISMLRTVEHLIDIDKCLRRIKSMLTKDGVLLIDIVNHDWLMRHFKDPCICTKIDHIYQLTDTTIKTYFKKLNYKIIGQSSATDRYITYLVQ